MGDSPDRSTHAFQVSLEQEKAKTEEGESEHQMSSSPASRAPLAATSTPSQHPVEADLIDPSSRPQRPSELASVTEGNQTPRPTTLVSKHELKSPHTDIDTSTENFPVKLYRMLEETEKEANESILSFVANGRAFAVHQPKRFVSDIMPRYFTTSRISSFQRQLNLYGFRRVTEGKNKGAYFHELFIKGQKALCKNITRKKPNEDSYESNTISRLPGVSLGSLDIGSVLGLAHQRDAAMQAALAAEQQAISLLGGQGVQGALGQQFAQSHMRLDSGMLSSTPAAMMLRQQELGGAALGSLQRGAIAAQEESPLLAALLLHRSRQQELSGSSVASFPPGQSTSALDNALGINPVQLLQTLAQEQTGRQGNSLSQQQSSQSYVPSDILRQYQNTMLTERAMQLVHQREMTAQAHRGSTGSDLRDLLAAATAQGTAMRSDSLGLSLGLDVASRSSALQNSTDQASAAPASANPLQPHEYSTNALALQLLTRLQNANSHQTQNPRQGQNSRDSSSQFPTGFDAKRWFQ